MCGIVGLVLRESTDLPVERVVRAMCGAIAHRGPDDEGVYVSGRAGIGARRLSIIDLASGHQPILNEDGSAAIAFNGEIYNYRALSEDLRVRGHRFRTNCDTETVLHLCEDDGACAPVRLRGMFAFAVWNDRTRELLLARDRFGIKPLYYATGRWGIAFASELKALVACGFTTRELDLEALDMYMELGYITAPRTPFADVQKLPPGHTLQWLDGQATLEQYWDLPVPLPASRATPQRVRTWIDDSVHAHLVSDVPVAAFLSGGLDSSTIVSSMAEQAESPHAFTVRYHGSGAEATDETSLARALATRCGARLTIVDVHPDISNIFEPIVRALDEPLADDSAIPTWLLCEAVARHYKVALTGTGGDELFVGYRRHLGLMAAEWYRRMPARTRRLLSGIARRIPERDNRAGLGRLKRFLDAGDGSHAERFLAFVSRLPANEHAELLRPIIVRDDGALPPSTAQPLDGNGAWGIAAGTFTEHESESRARDALGVGLYIDYKTFLPDDILALSDRLSMAHGLEVRVPFVDDALVECVYPLSRRRKIGLWTPKRLLRRAMRDRLPAVHFSAPKRGFVGPTGAWIRSELRDILTDELAPDRTRRLGLFDADVVARLLDDHLLFRRDREGILWSLLTFSTWHRAYVEAPSLHPLAREVSRAIAERPAFASVLRAHDTNASNVEAVPARA
jgi:asparagine synthase (glutamine-hydrolysing)